MSSVLLGRTSSKSICICAAVFCVSAVVCGSLAPFDFQIGTQRIGPAAIGLPDTPVSDVLANLLVYAPIGAAFALVFGRSGRSTRLAFCIAVLAATGLSFLMECLQTMIPSRCASWTDVGVNAVGATAGAVLVRPAARLDWAAVRLQTAWRHSPHAAAAGVLTVGLMVYHLLPFDFVLSTSAFHQSLTESIVAPLPTWGAFLETASRSAAGWSAAAGQFALLGYCVLAACRERGERLGSSVLAAVGNVALVAGVIEVVQIFVVSHTCDFLDWSAATAGGILGIFGAATLWSIGRFWSLRTVLGGALVVQLAYLLARNAAPFDFAAGGLAGAEFVFVPFAAYVERPFRAAAGSLLETFALYSVMAATLCYVLGNSSGRVWIAMITIPVAATAVVCELLHATAGCATADVTVPLIAACSAGLIAAWKPMPTDSGDFSPPARLAAPAAILDGDSSSR